MSAEELGKINKPKADHAQKSKKIYLVPLIINYFPDIEEFTSLLTEYWKACDNQINKLETQVNRKGLTLIPLNVTLKGSWIKIIIYSTINFRI